MWVARQINLETLEEIDPLGCLKDAYTYVYPHTTAQNTLMMPFKPVLQGKEEEQERETPLLPIPVFRMDILSIIFNP